MPLMRTAKVRADPLRELVSRQQPRGRDEGPFAMTPGRFNGVEPRTLAGQAANADAHALAGARDLAVVGADPAPDRLAHVPGGGVPDQRPHAPAPTRPPARAH